MKDKKRIKELEENIIVLKNYANVLKKKNKIQKDSMERMQKMINILLNEISRLREELKKYE